MDVFVFGLRGFPNIQGGVESHSQFLYSTLAKEKINFTVFRRTPFLNEKSRNFSKSNIKFIDLPSTKIKGFEAFFHSFLCSLISIIKRPNIVHVHNIGPAFFTPLLKLFGLKVIMTYHSPNYEHKKWNFIGKFILRLSELLSLTFADKIIFVSEQQRMKFSNKIKAKSIWIPNGVKIPSVNIENEKIFLKKYGLVQFDYLLYVGRITPEKGVDYLIKAFIKSGIKQKLVIAGNSDNQSSFFKEIENLCINVSNIVFTGFITGEELSALYKNSCLFILPSYNEGHPIALLEAMSYSLNILASDIPQNKEIGLPEDFYFPCGDVDLLCRNIKQKLAQEKRSYKYDLSKYDWGSVAQQTLNVYKEV